MQYDYKIIEERMRQLSPDLQEILTSVQITNDIKEISDKYEIKLDQEEILYNLTAYILLGLVESKNFVTILSKETGLDIETSTKIAKDINERVFDKIKTKMQIVDEVAIKTKIQQGDQPLSSLERVGGFSVEKEVVETENSDVTEADRGEILAGLENPQPRVATPGGNPPLNLPTDERSKGMPGAMGVGASINKTSSFTRPTNPTTPDNHTEPLVDYLLSKPAGQSTQKVSAEPTTNPSNPTSTAPKKSGPDPYRESVI